MNLYLENTGKGILITFLLLIGSMLYAQNNSKITIKKKNISLQTARADIRLFKLENFPSCQNSFSQQTRNSNKK